jgi:disulfide bond formation protein DsbB
MVMRSIVVAIAGLGVAGQIVAVLLLVAAVLATVGRKAPLAFARNRLKGQELWLACMVASFATAGSLFFSEVAHFPTCLLCWYERFCMYPLSILTLIVASAGWHRAGRWLLPIPIVGAGLSTYHVLIENGLATQSVDCLLSGVGGCGLKWINEFGYVTIPTLALTGFVLIIALLLFDSAELRYAEAKAEP